LEPPTHECDFGNLDRICPPPGQSTTFIRNAKLVPKDRILALLSLVFDMHWASRDAMLKGKPVPASLNPSVLRERHHALNWLTFYCDEDWDDIATDT
jgi:hypothetical protein